MEPIDSARHAMIRAGPPLHEPVVLALHRHAIERCDTAQPLRFLSQLAASAERVAQCWGTISLIVYGYDDDPRELYQIPEVRAYFGAIDRHFPYWFWFLSPVDVSLRMLTSCVCPLTADSRGEVSIEFDALRSFVEARFAALFALASQFGIEKGEADRVAAYVVMQFRNSVRADEAQPNSDSA